MLVNPKTQQRIDRFIDKPSHALLLVGSKYSGCEQIMHTIVAALHLANGAVHRQITPIGATISIQQVRELRSEERLKTSLNHNGIASVVSIMPIDAMQQEAQNALLKILEEPPSGTLFILVCHDESNLLSTITSRCMRIDVLPISLEQAKNKYTNDQLKQYYLMSSGEALLLDSLIADKSHHLSQAIADAKQLLAGSLADKLSKVDAIVKNQKTTECIDALVRMCKAALQTTSESKQSVWAHNLKEVLHAEVLLKAKVQPKLVLTNLFCSLKA